MESWLVISGAEVVEVPKEIKAKLDDLEKIVEEAKRRVGSDMADYFASPTSRDDERMGNIIQGHECGGKVDLGFRKNTPIGLNGIGTAINIGCT